MKLLIYGAGVIGCLYAALFSEAGYDTTIYARGKRLETLQTQGLQYEKRDKLYKADVKVIEELKQDALYDFIFLTVRENQVHKALEELKFNRSSNIVTMVNTLESYSNWEAICGKGRIIPAFPGAGGSYEDGILKARLTPKIIQATTFAEIAGKRTPRLKQLSDIFKTAKIPYQIVGDMHCWQVCHLALVIPIADAYYQVKNPRKAWKEQDVIYDTAEQIKRNMQTLHRAKLSLSPWKAHLFRLLPVWILEQALVLAFKSRFGDVFMYRHALKAPDEMHRLHTQFYQYLELLQANSSVSR